MKTHVQKKIIPKPLRTLVIDELDQIINSLFIESPETGTVIPIYKLVPDFSYSQDIFLLRHGSTVKAGKIPVLFIAIQRALFIARMTSTLWLRELLLKGYISYIQHKNKENEMFQCVNYLLVKIERFQSYFQFSNTAFIRVWDEVDNLNKNAEKNNFGDLLISISWNMCEALSIISTLENVHKIGSLVKKFIKGHIITIENNIIDSIRKDTSNEYALPCVDSKKVHQWHKQNNFL